MICYMGATIQGQGHRYSKYLERKAKPVVQWCSLVFLRGPLYVVKVLFSERQDTL